MQEILRKIKNDLESLKKYPEINSKDLDQTIRQFNQIYIGPYNMSPEEKKIFYSYSQDTQKNILSSMRFSNISLSKYLEIHEEYSGYVYFLKNNDTNLIKIGSTTNLKTRLQHLNILNKNIKYLFVLETEDYKKAEKYYHEIFTHKRVKGEWFNISESDIKQICPFFINFSENPVYVNSKKINPYFTDKKNFRLKKPFIGKLDSV